jgi:hypothetical protein
LSDLKCAWLVFLMNALAGCGTPEAGNETSSSTISTTDAIPAPRELVLMKPWPAQVLGPGDCVAAICLPLDQSVPDEGPAAEMLLRPLVLRPPGELKADPWGGDGQVEQGVVWAVTGCCRGNSGGFLFDSVRQLLVLVHELETYEQSPAFRLSHSWDEVYFCVYEGYKIPCQDVAVWTRAEASITWRFHIDRGQIEDASPPWLLVKDNETEFRLVNMDTREERPFRSDAYPHFQEGSLFFGHHGAVREHRLAANETITYRIAVDEDFFTFGPYAIQFDVEPSYAVHRETQERVDIKALIGRCVMGSYSFPWIAGTCDEGGPGFTGSRCIAVNIETKEVIRVGSTDMYPTSNCLTDGYMLFAKFADKTGTYSPPSGVYGYQLG